jgi:hypothetical protein
LEEARQQAMDTITTRFDELAASMHKAAEEIKAPLQDQAEQLEHHAESLQWARTGHLHKLSALDDARDPLPIIEKCLSFRRALESAVHAVPPPVSLHVDVSDLLLAVQEVARKSGKVSTSGVHARQCYIEAPRPFNFDVLGLNHGLFETVLYGPFGHSLCLFRETFELVTRDINGRPLMRGGARVEAWLEGQQDLVSQEVRVTDRKNGTYSIELSADMRQPCEMLLYVQVEGRHVMNSPLVCHKAYDGIGGWRWMPAVVLRSAGSGGRG